MASTVPSKRNTVVLLRWVLVIAFAYLLLLDNSASHVNPGVILLVAVALTSNIVIGRLPERWIEGRLFDVSIVLFDTAWVTLGLISAPNASNDLFLLYFLVIFIAAMGESLVTIVACAGAVGLAYGAIPFLGQSGTVRLTASMLLRVPFLFVVSLFYGYFVTEIRRQRNAVEEAQLREQAKSELLMALGHDLSGPLRNAHELLALALENDTRDAAGTRKLMLQGLTNIRRVTSLVANLMQAASIEGGKLRSQQIPLLLNDVAGETLLHQGGSALLHGVTLQKELQFDLPGVTGDPMQMGRIVTNLVDNAIKYTGPAGRVVVRTGTDGAHVWLSVEDSGVGMSPEECAALFAPEHEVRLNSYASGMRLGLYIARRLTEAQGGTLKVQSVPEKGSTFRISFPTATRKTADAA